jgi:CTP synthase
MRKTKWIVVSGGVLSGLGKGIVTASIGKLLNGLKVVPIKCDGYFNVDPGTMNPIEHGEVFVLDDGGEVDMDFGHYERFLNINCKFEWNLTSGKIFKAVIDKERRGDYLGKTVQLIPHITDEVKRRFHEIEKKENPDVVIIELGGTVGDIEMMWFYEAARQMKLELGKEDIIFVHLTYIPELESVGEQKTKPTQQSTQQLLQMGIQPDIIIGRSKRLLDDKSKEKIALFCNVKKEDVISNPNLDSVYELPLIFEKEGLDNRIKEKLGLKYDKKIEEWKKLVNNIKNPQKHVTIAICGKYTKLKDSYISIVEALVHAGANLKTNVNIKWVETTDIEEGKLKVEDALKDVNGIVIPVGFGSRGSEGKIRCIKYVRENNIPFLGICYGMQMAIVEFARNICNLKDANSTEIDQKTKYPVVDILPEQKEVTEKGATMRLGSYKAELKKGTKTRSLYNEDFAYERHRHRYEVNPEFHNILQKNGLIFSGTSKDGRLVEFIELKDKTFFVATQAHPELKSRLEKPSPLFYGLVKSCLK